MIVKFRGTQNLFHFVKNLDGIILDIQERAGLQEQPFKLRDVQLGIVFGEEGNEQYLTVEHDGVSEVFQIQVALNEKGEIDLQKDNQNETFLDDYSRAVSKGEASPVTEEIKSVFDDAELMETERINCGDIEEVHYTTPNGTHVIRYYRNGVLVAEQGIKQHNN